MTCLRKHTKYQPMDGEFKCPSCGAEAGDFACENSDLDAGIDDCDKIHVDDECMCYKCGYGVSAKAFVNRLVKEKDLVPCECCKGAGYVKRKVGSVGSTP